MDEWRDKLASELLGAKTGPRAGDFRPAPAQQLTIAFGHARTAVSHLLALGRTNNLPVRGDVTGDQLWIQLGAGRLRFLLDRARGAILVEGTGREPTVITWRGEPGGLVLPTGEPVDMQAYARAAIDGMVAAWKAGPGPIPGPEWPPRPLRARIHGMPPYNDAPPPGHINPPQLPPAPVDAAPKPDEPRS